MSYRYVQINDPHISDQPPRGRTASYLDDVLAKLAWCVQRANEIGVSGIVITGDLFHRKNAAHTTHRTVQRVREVLGAADARVHIVPGNHDEAHGGWLTGQPLLSVIDGTHIVLLDGASDFDSPIAGVPWDNAFEREGGVRLFAARVSSTRRPLVFAHAPISERPFPFGPEAQGWMLDSEIVDAMPPNARLRLIAHGHMHRQQPTSRWTMPGGGHVWFSNPGALSRATVGADDVERVPAIAIIDLDFSSLINDSVVTVCYEDVPHRPAAEVLRLEEHERDTDRADAVQALAHSSLERAFAEVVDADSLRALLRTLGCPEQFDEETWKRGLALAEAAIDGEVLS